jgi:hypothetical protein
MHFLLHLLSRFPDLRQDIPLSKVNPWCRNYSEHVEITHADTDSPDIYLCYTYLTITYLSRI